MTFLRLRIYFSLLVFALPGIGNFRVFAQAPFDVDLSVDATSAPRKILHTKMVMPVTAGPLTLYYPKWIPGEHMPSGPLGGIAGLRFLAGGAALAWRRDLLDPFTFHLDVPRGANRLEIEFDFIESSSGPYSAGNSATDKLVIVNWNQNVLYPAGVPVDAITVNPQLRLPEGWKYGSPLPLENAAGNDLHFKPVALNRLVDSPVLAGEYYRAFDITPAHEPIHHELDIVSDSQAALEMPADTQKGFTNMVAEALRLFGAPHYRDYHFLLTLSDHVEHFGLEHHECDDSRMGERTLLSADGRRELAGLLGHEFVHSWNGKFRRPADLAVPYFEAPMKTDLLWVYEGLTSFWGPLLAVRSGLWTQADYREDLAETAAEMGPGRPGRTWRPLEDTSDDEAGELYTHGGWPNWTRGVDYYPEGDLIWLEVATIIHDQSHGKKSLEDFARAFYGGVNNGPELKSYTFDDLMGALRAVTPYDWAGYFQRRLTSLSSEAPVEGITSGGWNVQYTDKPSESPDSDHAEGSVNAVYSIGLSVEADGKIDDALVGGPAYLAGISAGMRLMAVNDRAYTAETLRDALKATAQSHDPLRLLVLNDDYYKLCTINYHGGERYPHLARIEGSPDLLDDVAAPLTAHEQSSN